MKYTHKDGTPFTKEEFLQKLKTDKEFNNEFGNKGIDQISELIRQLKEGPDSRRLLVSAWAVHDLPNMVLPPCHYGFQVYTRELSREERWDLYSNRFNQMKPHKFQKMLAGVWVESTEKEDMFEYDIFNIPTRAISLMWNQRSVDTGLGLSFNVASYSLLLMMIAKQVNMVPYEVIGNLGDVHLYLNHIEPIKEQLTREPYDLPTVKITDRVVNDISEYTLDDFTLENYQYHPTIRMPLSN
jgi:thymidylate synthase